MSVNKVNSDGSLTRIAGGTLCADLPLLSWIKYDNQTNLPEGFLKAGDSISEVDCPEAYAKYGATVPYVADTSDLSDFESVVLPMTAPYDGFITASGYDGAYLNFSVNGTNVYIRSAATGINAATTSVPIHKGDTVAFASADGSYYVKARYYKKSLVLKAKQVALPADFVSAMDDIYGVLIPDNASASNKLTTMTEVKTLFATATKYLVDMVIPTTWKVDDNFNHLIRVKAQLKNYIPSGYKLYKATLDIAWSSGNSYDAYLAEVIATRIATSVSGTNKEAEFTLITRAEQTLGATYSPWNAYYCVVECVKE